MQHTGAIDLKRGPPGKAHKVNNGSAVNRVPSWGAHTPARDAGSALNAQVHVKNTFLEVGDINEETQKSRPRRRSLGEAFPLSRAIVAEAPTEPQYVALFQPHQQEAMMYQSQAAMATPYLQAPTIPYPQPYPQVGNAIYSESHDGYYPSTPEWSPWIDSSEQTEIAKKTKLPAEALAAADAGGHDPFGMLWSVEEQSNEPDSPTSSPTSPVNRGSPVVGFPQHELQEILEQDQQDRMAKGLSKGYAQNGGYSEQGRRRTAPEAFTSWKQGFTKAMDANQFGDMPAQGVAPPGNWSQTPPNVGCSALRHRNNADQSNEVGVTMAKTMPCKYFTLLGRCKFGELCRFSHVDGPSLAVDNGERPIPHCDEMSTAKQGRAVVAAKCQDSKRRAPVWTIIWCDERAFKAPGPACKAELQGMGSVVKAYKSAENCIRALEKKTLPVFPHCVALISHRNANTLIPYLSRRPTLIRGIVVLVESSKDPRLADALKQQFPMITAVVTSWPDSLVAVRAIMTGCLVDDVSKSIQACSSPELELQYGSL